MNKTTGKIKTFSFVSLDGYVSKMGGGFDWLAEYPRPSGGDYGLAKFAETVGCAVFNGIYYAALSACDLWPLGGIPSRVLLPDSSISIPGANPETFVRLRPDKGFGYVEAVDAIRRETDGDIWLAGDPEMLSVFLGLGMIDEITVNVVPVTLGNGHAPFSRNRMEQGWKMVHYECFDNGVMQLRYQAKPLEPTEKANTL